MPVHTHAMFTISGAPRALVSTVLLAIALLATGCGSGSMDSTAASGILTEDQTSMPPDAIDEARAPGQSEPDIGAVEPAPDPADPGSADPGTFDPDLFDIAELFFTESDRQWFCSVTNAASVFTDQLYVDRSGDAWFERFGTVTWRRHETRDELIVTTMAGEEWQVQEIFGSNTVLEFLLRGETTTPSLYSCVLTLRDAAAS